MCQIDTAHGGMDTGIAEEGGGGAGRGCWGGCKGWGEEDSAWCSETSSSNSLTSTDWRAKGGMLAHGRLDTRARRQAPPRTGQASSGGPVAQWGMKVKRTGRINLVGSWGDKEAQPSSHERPNSTSSLRRIAGSIVPGSGLHGARALRTGDAAAVTRAMRDAVQCRMRHPASARQARMTR